MDNEELIRAFSGLSTPLIADACVRLGVQVRTAPSGIRPLKAGMRIAGGIVPAQHYGSVDVFLEAMELALPGDVLVIDNQGRAEEGCIGDLTALEARASGLGGIVVWGHHRDSSDLLEIGYPIFSYGEYPAGPLRLDPRKVDALIRAQFGTTFLTKDDVVFGDLDGVVFVPRDRADETLTQATSIRTVERRQAELVRSGRKTLREQFHFREFLQKRMHDPSYTFRSHLRDIGAAIEE